MAHPTTVIALLRIRIRPDADLATLETLSSALYGTASAIPGFISARDYRSEDGETLSVIEWAHVEALTAWATHPDHVAAKRRWAEFFSAYSIQICDLRRRSSS